DRLVLVLRVVLDLVKLWPVPDVRTGSRSGFGFCSPPPPHVHRRYPGTSQYSVIHAPAADGSSESIRSIKPPCPGNNVPMSLTPRSRFINDSSRSPKVALQTMAAPKSMPSHQCPPSSRFTESAPATSPPSIDPPKPSQDFFGLTRGAIGWRPRKTPAA